MLAKIIRSLISRFMKKEAGEEVGVSLACDMSGKQDLTVLAKDEVLINTAKNLTVVEPVINNGEVVTRGRIILSTSEHESVRTAESPVINKFRIRVYASLKKVKVIRGKDGLYKYKSGREGNRWKILKKGELIEALREVPRGGRHERTRWTKKKGN